VRQVGQLPRIILVVLLTVSIYLTLVYYTTVMANLKMKVLLVNSSPSRVKRRFTAINEFKFLYLLDS